MIGAPFDSCVAVISTADEPSPKSAVAEGVGAPGEPLPVVPPPGVLLSLPAATMSGFIVTTVRSAKVEIGQETAVAPSEDDMAPPLPGSATFAVAGAATAGGGVAPPPTTGGA